MPPMYKPRDFDFNSVIQGMKGLQVNPVTMDEAIAQAQKLEQEDMQTQKMRKAQEDEAAYGNIDPTGQLSPEQVMDAALKIAAKQGDVKTVQSVLDHRTQRSMERERLDLSKERADRKSHGYIKGVGTVVWNDDGSYNVIAPEQGSQKETEWIQDKQTKIPMKVTASEANKLLQAGTHERYQKPPTLQEQLWAKMFGISLGDGGQAQTTPTAPNDSSQNSALPQVGQDYNGSKVKRVTKIR